MVVTSLSRGGRMNEDVSKIETITKRISKISVHNMKKKREKKTHSHTHSYFEWNYMWHG